MDMVQVLGQDTLQELAQMTPVGRLGTAEDIAHAVAFFASEKASFITGQVLTADEMNTLINNLFKCSVHGRTPDGKTIIYVQSDNEIARNFSK